MRLILCRHGETLFNRLGLITGRFDVGLTQRGARQARLLAQALVGHRAAALYTSDLRRAVQTAACMERTLRLAPVLCAELRERDFGCLTGRPLAEYLAAEAAWGGPPADFRPEGGESFAEVGVRVARLLERMRRALGTGPVIVVAHGTVMRAIAAACRRGAAGPGGEVLLLQPQRGLVPS